MDTISEFSDWTLSLLKELCVCNSQIFCVQFFKVSHIKLMPCRWLSVIQLVFLEELFQWLHIVVIPVHISCDICLLQLHLSLPQAIVHRPDHMASMQVLAILIELILKLAQFLLCLKELLLSFLKVIHVVLTSLFDLPKHLNKLDQLSLEPCALINDFLQMQL